MTRIRSRRTVLTIGAAAVVVVALSLVPIMKLASGGRAEAADVPRAPAPAPPGDSPPQPVGQQGDWKLAFSDEFQGITLDRSKWADQSSAEADDGHGNPDNEQREWNQAANCAVSGGELVMTAKRENFTSPSGARYDWTSCLLSTEPSYAFQYGYIEERAVLPAPKGFWPAFWTWQADADTHVETDVYEFYSTNRHELLLTQHSGRSHTCRWQPGFDPAAGWHTYAASIEPSGTVWYVDGAEVCRTADTSDGAANIITNLAVHAPEPPDAGTTTAVKRVDYIRAWQRQ